MNRPQVLIACSERVRHGYLSPEELTRLEQVADWAWFACEGGNIYHASEDAEATAQLAKEMGAVDALVICHGAPRIGESILAAAPRLRLIGELEGDRFATRIDLDAAWARGIRIGRYDQWLLLSGGRMGLGADADCHAQCRRALPPHPR